jgi:hypothetical protein
VGGGAAGFAQDETKTAAPQKTRIKIQALAHFNLIINNPDFYFTRHGDEFPPAR